jgi:hypothetical protein
VSLVSFGSKEIWKVETHAGNHANSRHRGRLVNAKDIQMQCKSGGS